MDPPTHTNTHLATPFHFLNNHECNPTMYPPPHTHTHVRQALLSGTVPDEAVAAAAALAAQSAEVACLQRLVAHVPAAVRHHLAEEQVGREGLSAGGQTACASVHA